MHNYVYQDMIYPSENHIPKIAYGKCIENTDRLEIIVFGKAHKITVEFVILY